MAKPNPETSSSAPAGLGREERACVRAKLFRHLDGFPIAPTMASLRAHGVLDSFANAQTVPLRELAEATGANEGYLQVALRLLCSQGWLVQDINPRTDTIKYTITNKTRIAFDLAEHYAGIVRFLPLARCMDDCLYGEYAAAAGAGFSDAVARHGAQWGLAPTGDPEIDLVRLQVRMHLDGILLGPVLVALARRGDLDGIAVGRPLALRVEREHEPRLRALFHACGWLDAGDRLTPHGAYHLQRASAYGVTVSYLPMFLLVDELLFGDGEVLWRCDPGGPERHVDRAMNVWGSGGAHAAYFRRIDEIVIDIFNRPIGEQPKGIADMGCGNGALLAHIFDVIWAKTARGKVLDEHPLFIVGSDCNQAALDATRRTLDAADVWAHVVFGDIGDPDALARELEAKHGVRLDELLSVRSFLDHNRVYEPPARIDTGRASRSTGAFAFRGRRVANNAIEQDLVDHLKRWSPYVGRFGLLVLELHTIRPKLAALNVGRTNVTAYDGTHGYSDQYILELEVFLSAAEEAGLFASPEYQATYPPSDLATISINLLRAR